MCHHRELGHRPRPNVEQQLVDALNFLLHTLAWLQLSRVIQRQRVTLIMHLAKVDAVTKLLANLGKQSPRVAGVCSISLPCVLDGDEWHVR